MAKYSTLFDVCRELKEHIHANGLADLRKFRRLKKKLFLCLRDITPVFYIAFTAQKEICWTQASELFDTWKNHPDIIQRVKIELIEGFYYVTIL